MPSVRMYNVNSHENKEKPLHEKVCQNFWLVVYFVKLCIKIVSNVKTQRNPQM